MWRLPRPTRLGDDPFLIFGYDSNLTSSVRSGTNLLDIVPETAA